MTKQSGLLCSLLLALFAHPVLGANFLGFNSGPFYSIVGSADAPTDPTYLQVLFDGPVFADTFISITSSDPSRLTITGGGVTVLTGQSGAFVQVSSFSLGDVTVTGYFQDVVATNLISVVSEIPADTFRLNIESLPGAVKLAWSTNATGYLLETNHVLTNPAGWGVLASNPGILHTNHVVTNAVSDAAMFYRLHKP